MQLIIIVRFFSNIKHVRFNSIWHVVGSSKAGCPFAKQDIACYCMSSAVTNCAKQKTMFTSALFFVFLRLLVNRIIPEVVA